MLSSAQKNKTEIDLCWAYSQYVIQLRQYVYQFNGLPLRTYCYGTVSGFFKITTCFLRNRYNSYHHFCVTYTITVIYNSKALLIYVCVIEKYDKLIVIITLTCIARIQLTNVD